MTPLLAGLVHGLGLVALAIVIGGLALEQLILPTLPELAVAKIRLRRWITGCVVVLALTTIAELVIRSQAMSRAPVAVVIAGLPEILHRTHFGEIVAVRLVVLALALVLSLARAAPLRASFLVVAVGIALTTSLIGHAADWGDLTVSVAVDWVHGVAASAWTGGLITLALAVLGGHAAWPPRVVGAVARRFSRLAGVCLLVVAVTGGYNAWTQLGALSRLWTTTYGLVLLGKLVAFAALAGLGAVTRYVVLPGLDPHRRARGFGVRVFRVSRLVIFGPQHGARPPRAASRFAGYVASEALIALAVFACTAALVELAPGRHALLEGRLTSHVPPIQLRQSSGAGSGTVTPPPGNATRGRSVFVKLLCFTCHAVPDDRLPAPSRPGPELSGIGRRHPGYLVESILNPNAMIVDGPGYTDDRGLSTMPDYREKLTVSELIDLVAYLKSLAGSSPPARN